jgi:hypothetical protein
MNVNRSIPSQTYLGPRVSNSDGGNAASCPDRITRAHKWLSDAMDRLQCGSFDPNITSLRPFWHERTLKLLIPTGRCRTRIKHKTHSPLPR